MIEPKRPSAPARARRFGIAAALFAALLSGCTDNSTGTSTGPSDAEKGAPVAIDVASSDETCDVSDAEVRSGDLEFTVANTGSTTTEFYLLSSDGAQTIGEVENIGPGITRKLVVQAAPGDYLTVCKPGMVGDGIRAEFTITD